MSAQMIEARNEAGRVYYSTTRRGIDYVASCDVYGWFVRTQCRALRRAMMGGGVKRYKSLADLSANCKAFAGLDVLVESEGVKA